MAEIPTVSGPQVQEAPVPGVRVQTDAPIAAFGGGQAAAGLTAASEGLQEHAQQYATEEKRKADQVAHMMADRKATDLETQLQVGVSKLKGQDALFAPDYIQENWQKGVREISEGLSNEDQKIAFMRSADARWDSLNKTTQMHVAGEAQQLDQSETQGYIASSRSAAVLNAFDGERVNQEIARQTAVVQDWAKRNGLTGTETEKAKLAETLSGSYKDVIQARLDAGHDDKAKELFAEAKGTMTAQDQLTIDAALKQGEILSLGNRAWNSVQGMRLANGEPDEAKMRSAVFSMDVGPMEKEKIWDYVKARSGEAVSNQAREAQARDRGFLNQVLQNKKQGAPLSDQIRLAQKSGIDPYEQNVFADAAKKIYAPTAVESDKSLYMNLWERVQDGGSSKQEIDQAWQNNKLSNADWESLRKNWYNIKTGVTTDPGVKNAWERVKDLAEQNFGSSKVDRDNFIYVLHDQFRGNDKVAPEQIIKAAQDSLKTQGQHPWFGVSFMPSWGTGETGWKSDLKKTDAANLAWGTAYQDLGKDAVDAFREGVQFQNKRDATPGDLNAFADQYGGYQNVKPGTPVHNAILSIQKAGRPVVPANIDWVLKKYPDGVMK